MASEDDSHQPSSQPIPDYPQMIMEAIEALNEPEGSSKLAISNYIESNYLDLTLTPAHSTLLSNTLEKLKQTGDLILDNGNYLKPESESEPESEEDAPAAKRGRGRPPKPKDPSAIEAISVPGYTRSRGRPPKPRDPLAPQAEHKKISGRPRGRPRKYPKEDEEEAAAPVAVSGVKRGRGRPPKVKT